MKIRTNIKNKFVFMDETGLLNDTKNQPYFAIGLLKILDTSPMYHVFEKLLSKAKQLHKKKNFEFKFADIRLTDYKIYMDLLNEYFSFSTASCAILVIDKTDPEFGYKSYFEDTWSAQIEYAKMLLKRDLSLDEMAIVIADHLPKPKASTKYFENEMRQNSKVLNACMLESHASLFIQIIDVLIGAVVYDFKREKSRSLSHVGRNAVCDFLNKKLGRENLTNSFSVTKPNEFKVWQFKPRKK